MKAATQPSSISRLPWMKKMPPRTVVRPFGYRGPDSPVPSSYVFHLLTKAGWPEKRCGGPGVGSGHTQRSQRVRWNSIYGSPLTKYMYVPSNNQPFRGAGLHHPCVHARRSVKIPVLRCCLRFVF